jgi:hypothetical protein
MKRLKEDVLKRTCYLLDIKRMYALVLYTIDRLKFIYLICNSIVTTDSFVSLRQHMTREKK